MPHQPLSEKPPQSSANEDPVSATPKAPGKSTPSRDRYAGVGAPATEAAPLPPVPEPAPQPGVDRPPPAKPAELLEGPELAGSASDERDE